MAQSTPPPGTIAIPARSAVQVDGIPLAAQAASSVTPSQQAVSAAQRFWSSEPRSYGDETNEMMIVSLNAPKLINYVSMSLPHFPAQYSIAWRDTNGNWAWIEGPNGLTLQYFVTGSVPGLVDSAAALSAGLNPYHYGAGHWIAYDEPILPVTATALLVAGTRAIALVLKNINPGTLPHNAAGRPVPYPLGVQNFDFGYRVLAAADVPYSVRSQSVVSERQSFTVAEDINGNPAQLTMRENRASDLLNGSPWKCAPQPSSAAVVNLYADSRDPAGKAQVIDRFFIAPTTSGVTLNLYYAQAAPPAGSGFQAVDTPLGFPAVTPAGSVPPQVSQGGLLFGNQPGWCDVSDQATGIDFTQPWWTAVEVQPQFGSADQDGYFIFDCGMVQLWYEAGTWAMSAQGQGTFAEWAADHTPGDRLQFACGWDGERVTGWSSVQPDALWSVTVPESSPMPPPLSPAGLGAPLNGNPLFAQGTAGWTGFDGGIVPATALPQPAPVAQGLLLTPSGTAPYAAIESAGTGLFTAAPNTMYGWSGWVYPVGTGVVELGFDWENSSGTYLSTTSDIIDLPANTWTYATFTFTSPASAAKGVIRAGRNGGSTNVPATSKVYSGFLAAYGNVTPGFAQAPVSYSAPGPGMVRFGAPQQADMIPALWPGNYRLTSWILKQEAPAPTASAPPSQYTAFAAGPPQQYTAPAAGPGPTTQNACGRFDASFANTMLSPLGFAGGIGSAWALASWTPLTSDYKLAAGYLQFRPVTAAAFRFEFTGLLAQPYSYYKATPQTANYFSPSQSAPPVIATGSATVSATAAALTGVHGTTGAAEPLASADPGLAVGQSVSAPGYADTAPAPQPYPPGRALPTETIYATDPKGAEAMTAQSSVLNFQPWQAPAQGTARQVIAGQSAYQEISVTQQSAVAYFAGISELTMFRANYSAATDTAEYIDTFGDTAGIDPASLQYPAGGGTTVPWNWSPGLLSAPASLPPGGYAQVRSPVYASEHQVTGVQFAAVESGPLQLLPDPSFTQAGLPGLSAAGDAYAPAEGSLSSPLGSLVLVQRSPGQQSWASVAASYATWAAFSSPVQLTWMQLAGGGSEGTPYGGVAYTGEPVAVSAAGRLTIAARVWSSEPLQAPLILQLLDGATGIVIAEEPVTVSGSTVTEWYAQCTVGESVPGAATWSTIQAQYATWGSMAAVPWSQLDATAPALGATVTWQIIEQGLFADGWGVDNVSIFEDSVRWDFSCDAGASWQQAAGISANPSGALVFGPPAQGIGNQLMWRLTSYRPSMTVASLAIRPWYSVYPRGIPPRVQGVPHGPNVSAQDFYGPIEQDPYWQAWSGPVPQDWYWAYQQQLLAGTTYVPPAPALVMPSDIILGNALVTGDTPQGAETYEDLYADRYGYAYGIADASQDYADGFGNGAYYDDFGPNL